VSAGTRGIKGGPGGETFGSAGAPESRFATPAVRPATRVVTSWQASLGALAGQAYLKRTRTAMYVSMSLGSRHVDPQAWDVLAAIERRGYSEQ